MAIIGDDLGVAERRPCPEQWTRERKLVFFLEEFTMAKRKTTRRFSDELEVETVKLAKRRNQSMAEIAMELGINAKSIGESEARPC